MDYQKKIIQKNEEKNNLLTQIMEEKLKKIFKKLYAKREKTTKRIKNENDNTITKIKLGIKKVLIVEYIHEKRIQFVDVLYIIGDICIFLA